MMFFLRFKRFVIIVVGVMVISVITLIFINQKSNNRYKHDNKMTTKVIGISVSYQEDRATQQNYGYLYDKQLIRVRYIDSFVKSCSNKNVVFVLVPIDKKQINKIADLVDGMVFTGGDDMDPSFYGQTKDPKIGDIEKKERIEFDIDLIKKMMRRKKPILGLCLGAQELNVAFGGTLIQDISSRLGGIKIDHNKDLAKYLSHSVKIDQNSLLHKIVGQETILVNSRHHQAVDEVADKFVAVAVAPDGIIEAIECKDCDNFVLGLQWHPELLISKDDEKILQAFCDAVIGDDE